MSTLAATSTASVSNAAFVSAATTAATSNAATTGAAVATAALTTANAALTTTVAAATTSVSQQPLQCVGPLPLPSAVCVNGVWLIADPNVNTNDPVTAASPIIFVGSATLGGTITVLDPASPTTPAVSATGCVTLSGGLNITAADPSTVPPSLYVVNSTCVVGNFSSITTNYRVCKGKSLKSSQQTTAGRGLEVLFVSSGKCGGSGPAPWLVAVIIVVAALMAIILIVIIVLLIRARPNLLQTSDDSDGVHFRLMDEAGKLPPGVATTRRSAAPSAVNTLLRNAPPAAGTGTMPYTKTLPRPPSTDRDALLAGAAAEPIVQSRPSSRVVSGVPPWLAAAPENADLAAAPEASSQPPRISMPPPTEAPPLPSFDPRLSLLQRQSIQMPAGDAPPTFEAEAASYPSRISMPPPSEAPPMPERTSMLVAHAAEPRTSMLLQAAAAANAASAARPTVSPERTSMLLEAAAAAAAAASGTPVDRGSLLLPSGASRVPSERTSGLSLSRFSLPPPADGPAVPAFTEADVRGSSASAQSLSRFSLPPPAEPTSPTGDSAEADLLAAIAESDAALNSRRGSARSSARISAREVRT